MNVLVDTNVISELRRGRNAATGVVTWFAAMPAENVFTSVIVLGEIRRGGLQAGEQFEAAAHAQIRAATHSRSLPF